MMEVSAGRREGDVKNLMQSAIEFSIKSEENPPIWNGYTMEPPNNESIGTANFFIISLLRGSSLSEVPLYTLCGKVLEWLPYF